MKKSFISKFLGLALGLVLGVGALVGANRVQANAAKAETDGTKTLTITRSSFSTAGGYAWYDWSAKTSGGTDIAGKGELYTTATGYMQFNKSNGNKVAALFNTTALPGKITKIEGKTKSGTNRAWNAFVSSSAWSLSGTSMVLPSSKTQINATAVTILDTELTTIGTNTGKENFFCLQENVTGASYIEEFVITYVVSSTPDYATPIINGLTNEGLYAPSHEDIDLSVSWSTDIIPTIESYAWSSDNDAVTIENANTATPTIKFDDTVTTYETVTISLKINNSDDFETSTVIYVAPHILNELTISDSKKSEYMVNDSFDIGTPSITAKFVDKVNDTLEASDLTFSINDSPISLGTPMTKEMNGKALKASYTFEGVTKTKSWTITVNDKIMPTPVFEGGWNKVTSNSLTIGDQIVLAGAVQGFVGDGNENHKDWFVMSTTQATNNRRAVAATFNADQSKITDLPEDAQVLTVVAGNTTGTIALYTGEGYLAACSSSNNYMHTDTNLSDDSSFTYNISAGVCTFTAQGTYTRNKMQFNSGGKSSAPLFSCYSSAQQGIAVYRNNIVDTDKAYVQQWINDNLHFQTIATNEKGNGSCLSSSWYADAKADLLSINEEHSSTTNAIILALVNSENTEFADAVARYEAWAVACNDAKPYGDTGISPVTLGLNNLPSVSVSDVAILITVTAVIAVTTLLGYILISKKRKENY